MGGSAPFQDADIMFITRAATDDQVQTMVTRYPDFTHWQSEVSARWPVQSARASAATGTAAPAAPSVPEGPPVNVAPAGELHVDAFLEVGPASSDLPPQFLAGNDTVRLVGYNVGTPGNVPCTVPLSNFTSLCETVANNGGNSLRLFGYQSMGGPGQWQAFDDALSAAQAHGLKIVWVLGNQWGNCENIEPGTSDDGYHQPAWYQGGYKQAGGGNALSYRDFALATVQRYKTNPTIAMWSLLNEAEAGTVVQGTTCPNETLSTQAMTSFVADMADAIRAVDPHHLLALGTRGQADNCGLQDDHYMAVQKPLDVLTLHSYAMTYDRAQTLSNWASLAGKPLVMTEHAQCGATNPCSANTDPEALTSRACDMEKFAVSLASLGVAAEMPWLLQQPDVAPNAYSLTANDPLLARLKNFAAGGSFPLDETC